MKSFARMQDELARGFGVESANPHVTVQYTDPRDAVPQSVKDIEAGFQSYANSFQRIERALEVQLCMRTNPRTGEERIVRDTLHMYP